MRAVWLVLALAACATDDADPHAVITGAGCDTDWRVNGTPPVSCEAACAVRPISETAIGCDTTDGKHCDTTFDWKGNHGCCVDDPNPPGAGPFEVVFAECR